MKILTIDASDYLTSTAHKTWERYHNEEFKIENALSMSEAIEMTRNSSDDYLYIEINADTIDYSCDRGLAYIALRGYSGKTGILIYTSDNSRKDEIQKFVQATKMYYNRNNGVIVHKDIVLYKNSYTIHIRNEPVTLTMNDFRLLQYFMDNRGVTLSFDLLYKHILDNEGVDLQSDYDALTKRVRRLRDKLKQYTNDEYIHSVRTIGYRFE